MDIKYEIVRSVSKTIQEKQFEPRSHFSSHKMGFSEVPSEEEIEKMSKVLLQRAERDIEGAFGVTKTVVSPEQEYFNDGMVDLGNGQGKFPKVFQANPKEPWRPNNESKYTATDREGGRELIDKESNTSEPF